MQCKSTDTLLNLLLVLEKMLAFMFLFCEAEEKGRYQVEEFKEQ